MARSINENTGGAALSSKLKKALITRAVGGKSRETVEEYAFCGEESGLKLVKRKVSTKYNPPDVAAVKALLSLDGGGLEDIPDARLIGERDRLIAEMQAEEECDEE